jgi:Arc/MetJ family transcription regulator
MRTTLDIDDDVLSAAKQRAAEEKTTAGKVISDLVRQALTQTAAEVGSAEARHGLLYEDGWYVRPSRGGIVTNELIDRIEEELDRDDARPAGRERASGTDG